MGRRTRWDGTIWNASPAAMWSLARSTAAMKPARVISAAAAPASTGSAAGAAAGWSSAAVTRSTSARGPVTVIVRRTWSNATDVDASRNRITGRPASAGSGGGSGTGSSCGDPVVAQEADRAAHERRLPGGRAGARGRKCGRLGERVDRGQPGSQERVAADLLAPLDRLEQERRGAQGGAQAQVGADRGDQVGGQDAGVEIVVHGRKKASRRMAERPSAKRGCRGRASGPHLARIATTMFRRSSFRP